MTKQERTIKRRAIIKNIKQGAGITQSCEEAGVPYPTYVYWKKKYPRFERQVTLASTIRVQTVEDALYKSAIGGDVRAQIFFLKNRGTNWEDTPLIDNSIKSVHYEWKQGNSHPVQPAGLSSGDPLQPETLPGSDNR